MERASDIGWWDHDGERFFAAVRLGGKGLTALPQTVEAFFCFSGLKSLIQHHIQPENIKKAEGIATPALAKNIFAKHYETCPNLPLLKGWLG